MEFNNIHLRFKELENGDLVVCVLSKKHNWNQTGVVLGIYYDGYIYDQMIKEDLFESPENLNLTDIVEKFAKTGINVKDIKSPVLA